MPPSITDDKIDILIGVVTDKLEEQTKRHEKGIDEIKALFTKHVEEDKHQFGLFSKELTALNITLTALNTTVKELKGSFISWSQFVGIVITLAVLIGGALVGVYVKLGGLSDRIASIEYVANNPQDTPAP